MARLSQRELVATEARLLEHLAVERARSDGDVVVEVADVARKLGVQERAVKVVLSEWEGAPSVDIEEKDGGREWSVSA